MADTALTEAGDDSKAAIALIASDPDLSMHREIRRWRFFTTVDYALFQQKRASLVGNAEGDRRNGLIICKRTGQSLGSGCVHDGAGKDKTNKPVVVMRCANSLL